MKSKFFRLSFFTLLGIMILVNSCEKIQQIFSINTEKCVRCNLCVPTCGYAAISIDSVAYVTADSFSYTTTLTIDPQKCVGCGECNLICPEGAIASNISTNSGSGSTNNNSNGGTSNGSTDDTTDDTTGDSTGNNNGSTTTTYSVNSSKCTGCGHCIRACSYGALTMSGRKAVINASKCTGCGKCVSYCSKGAIYKN